MEIMDEFDNEYPLVVSFCERISPQEYEGQGLSYTQKSLQELFSQMEQNPSVCERIVRKRKQADNETASLGQYLKAKFFALLQGDVNYGNAPGKMEMEEKVEQLKREMEKANNYARAAKSSSWRLSERRIRRPVLSGGFSPAETKPLDSGVPVKPRILGTPTKQIERSNSDLKQIWAGISPVNQKSLVDLRSLMLNPGGFRPSFFSNNSAGLLKYSFPKIFASNLPSSSSQGAGSSSTTSVFNTPVLSKFTGNQDDETDNETPSPDTNPTGA